MGGVGRSQAISCHFSCPKELYLLCVYNPAPTGQAITTHPWAPVNHLLARGFLLLLISELFQEYLRLTFALQSENILSFITVWMPFRVVSAQASNLGLHVSLLNWSYLLPYVTCPHLSQPSRWIAQTKLRTLCHRPLILFSVPLTPCPVLLYFPHRGFSTCVPVTVHNCTAHILNVDICWSAAQNHSTMILKLSFKIYFEQISRHMQH